MQNVTTLIPEHSDEICESIEVSPELPVTLVNELDHVEEVLDGYSQLLSHDEMEHANLQGSESYAMTVLKLRGYEGCESWMETLKKSAEAAYKAIIETLRSIKEFFFGEGEKQVQAADEKAQESVEALAELDKSAPVPDGKVKEPTSYFKGLGESVEHQKLLDKHPSIKQVIDKINQSVSRVANSQTVGQLGAVYQDIRKSAAGAAEELTKKLKESISKAEKAANEMKSPKTVADDAPQEVKDAAKAEHKETVDEAKDETKQSRLIASLRNKIVTVLNAVSSNANSVKVEKPESEFKG